jgi:hypothetical protein
MLPSLHDDFLISHEVNCETRQIKLHAKRDPRIPAGSGERTNHTIIFNGVEGYQFENDNFVNIIFRWRLYRSSEFSPRTAHRLQRLIAWQAPQTRGPPISRLPRKYSRQRVRRVSF